jgi:hypothetical protein
MSRHQHAAQCIAGNLSADSHMFREQLVANGAVVPVARMLLAAAPSTGATARVSVKAATVAAWALSNLISSPGGAGGTPVCATMTGKALIVSSMRFMG